MTTRTTDQDSPVHADTVAAVLKSSVSLATLSDAAHRRIVVAGSAVSREVGELLCQAGDVGDAFYVVVEGEIEVLASTEGGRNVRLAALGPGALAGEMAALDGGARSADMVAARRSLLWRIPRTALIDALLLEPSAAVALVSELSRRLRAANALIESATFLDLGGRLAKVLLEEGGAQGLAAMTQTEIARRISASREKVNRKLHAWAQVGWVELAPQGVRLLRPEALWALIDTVRRR